MFFFPKLNFKGIVNQTFIGLLLVSVLSNGVAQGLKGTYQSNFPSAGFFITKITFTSSSTFNYVFEGDVIHKELSGTYWTRNGDVYLLFDEGDGPTIKFDRADSAEVKEFELATGTKLYEYPNANYHGYTLKDESGVHFHKKYKFENGRLYGYRADNGELVRTDRFYNGKKWVDKESYLERIN